VNLRVSHQSAFVPRSSANTGVSCFTLRLGDGNTSLPFMRSKPQMLACPYSHEVPQQIACHCTFEALTAFSERSFSKFGSSAEPAPCLLETVTTPGTAPVCKYDWGLELATSAGPTMQVANSADCQHHCDNKITPMKDCHAKAQTNGPGRTTRDSYIKCKWSLTGDQ
jgi:hypothetical protein